MEKKFYDDESGELNRQLLAWLEAPGPEILTVLSLGNNCTLEPQVSAALVASPAMQSVTALIFHEIYVTPDQLREFLTLPALDSLDLKGGYSQDWSGPEYIWNTLTPEHLEVFLHDPNARKLKSLAMSNQLFSAEAAAQLRQALPQLESLSIEYKAY